MYGSTPTQHMGDRAHSVHWAWKLAAAVALIVGGVEAFTAFFHAARLHQQFPAVPSGLFPVYGAVYLLYAAGIGLMVTEREWGGLAAVALGLGLTLSELLYHYPVSPIFLALVPLLFVLQARRARGG